MKEIEELANGGIVENPSLIDFDRTCVFFPPAKVYENMRTDEFLEDMLMEFNVLSGKIGIGISRTPDRDLVDVSKWHKLMPNNSTLVVENDINFTGVAATKNRLLAQLDDCDHIFLFDDDTYPIAPGWWKPYVESKEPHLVYQFKLPGKPKSDMRELYRDEDIVAYSHTRGAMLYIERRVLDVVGGMDTRYNNGYEHPDWTNRIHNAGLTTLRAMDVPGSDKLLYCLDQDGKVESSIKKDRISMLENRRLYLKSLGSKEYKEYR